TGSSAGIEIGNVDKNALSMAIESAQSLHDAAVEGTQAGMYAVGSKATLQAAISSAIAVRDSASATQSQVNQSVSELNAALQTFLTKLITLVPGETSITIKDLSLVVKYFGKKSTDEGWDSIALADLFDNGEITIQTLAGVARMILDDWLAQ
ncbi:hypothetical protein K0U00_44670, partial [Paenibacillus sepulcri]|nr:hypothetical protein [Paenibacillus sepulcri]